jgi:membrane-bound lytic murein transglycosylase B
LRIHAALVATLASIPSAQTEESFPGTPRFDLTRPDIQQFVEKTASANGLEVDAVYALLAKAEPQPKILEAIARPAERVVPWWEYRERFVTAQRIRDGVQFWGEHRERLEAVSRETGVAPEYIVAILGVETSYGRITGRYRVLDALATLAFDYPPRSPFFQSELANFLLLVREEPVDPLTALGSYAGAMGAPQFMPSSYRRYATDGDGDGRRDLFTDWNDVIASVANYFTEHGWKAGAPVLIEATVAPDAELELDVKNLKLTETLASARERGVRFESDLPGDTPVILVPAELEDGTAVRIGFGNFETITRYNRSVRYAMAVHDLAQALAAGVYEPS